jgi:act minimal PKS acyl carrier protein
MAAKDFTLDDLRRTLRAAAGEGEDTNLDSDILDLGFADLGYDSLAMLETARRIELDRGVALADSTVTDAETPRALLAAVNDELAKTAQ